MFSNRRVALKKITEKTHRQISCRFYLFLKQKYCLNNDSHNEKLAILANLKLFFVCEMSDP